MNSNVDSQAGCKRLWMVSIKSIFVGTSGSVHDASACTYIPMKQSVGYL